jgi:hypothetical protein
MPTYSEEARDNWKGLGAMAMRFAGAKGLDERRRRRLAVDQGEDDMTDELTDVDGVAEESKQSPLPKLSLRSVVPRSGWAVAAWSLLILGLTGTVIAAAWYEQAGVGLLGGAYARLLGLESIRVGTWVASGLLVFAAQLSLVIGWVRGHCLTDFDGRYRAWTRVGLSWLVIGAVVGTGAHESLADFLITRFGFEGIWQREILAWLMPLAALVASVAWVMNGELKTNWSARFMLWTSALVAAGGLALTLEPALIKEDILKQVPRAVHLLKLAALVLSPALLVVAMLVFLRHVVHVSPEPAPRRRWRKTKSRSTEMADELVESEEAYAPEDGEAYAEEEEEEEEEETVYAEEYAEEEQEQEQEQEEEDAYSSYGDDAQDEHEYRFDESEQGGGFPDPQALKGLSKRERRRLRKQWRNEQRESRS